MLLDFDMSNRGDAPTVSQCHQTTIVSNEQTRKFGTDRHTQATYRARSPLLKIADVL